MDNYIDERTKEQFTEDTAIREAINNIYDMLAEMPKEKRRAFFEQISKPKDFSFPSGHTMCSVLFYGLLIYLVNKYNIDFTLVLPNEQINEIYSYFFASTKQ